ARPDQRGSHRHAPEQPGPTDLRCRALEHRFERKAAHFGGAPRVPGAPGRGADRDSVERTGYARRATRHGPSPDSACHPLARARPGRSRAGEHRSSRMKVGRTHLTYCTNIHPGESWSRVFSNLRTDLLEVRDLVSVDQPFGVGLRLSAEAADTLVQPEPLAEFRSFLEQERLYVFTLNGFPYGPFHGQAVKAAVYQPDWT